MPERFVVEQAEVSGSRSSTGNCVKDVAAIVTRATDEAACGDYAQLTVRVTFCGQSSRENTGLAVALAKGALPRGFEMPKGPLAIERSGDIFIPWRDRADDFSFTLNLTPVDKSGVRGLSHVVAVASKGPTITVALVVVCLVCLVACVAGVAVLALWIKGWRRGLKISPID
jgi:hypothetical protein